MIAKRGGMRRRAAILASTPGAIVDLARGLWRRDSGSRWLTPLSQLRSSIKGRTRKPSTAPSTRCG